MPDDGPIDVGDAVTFEGPFWDGRGGRLLADYMRTAMRAGVAVVERSTATRTPVNTGALRASFGGRITETGRLAEGVPAQMLGQVGSPITYAPHVEFGTKPHWPPRAPIEAWVRRKMVAQIDELVGAAAKRPRASGRPSRRTAPVRFSSDILPADERERAIRALTFLVSRKIAKRGTKGVKMLTAAIRRESSWVVRAFQAGVRAWARDVGR